MQFHRDPLSDLRCDRFFHLGHCQLSAQHEIRLCPQRRQLILFICVELIYGNWTQLQALLPARGAEILAKIGATGIVMVYNFVTRKIFMEKHD